LLLGTAGGFLAFLPVGGAALVWAPTVAGLWVAGELTRGLILLVWGALIVSGIDNVVKPVLIGSRAHLSTPMLFFGIIGGLQAYGLIGLFLGPSVLAAFSCLMGIYREQYLDQRAGAPLDPS
jgi:predicted PurR-regulated permease PerM